MSRLDELIQELCSDGVEYTTFGNVATIVRGASPRPIANYITDDEEGVNWVKIGDVQQGDKYVEHTKEKITIAGAQKSKLVQPGDFILSNSMSFGRPYIMKIAGCIHDGWLSISEYEKNYITDFLYYLLNSSDLQTQMAQKASQGGSIKNLNADIVKALEVPVPPLKVQREIVCVLDSLTLLQAELQTELQAELIARKKQYEHYRDKLLSFKKMV